VDSDGSAIPPTCAGALLIFRGAIMTHKRQGQLTLYREWWKHLRKAGHRRFWKCERLAEKEDIKAQLEGTSVPAPASPTDYRTPDEKAD
jgi:hypothetical protein